MHSGFGQLRQAFIISGLSPSAFLPIFPKPPRPYPHNIGIDFSLKGPSLVSVGFCAFHIAIAALSGGAAAVNAPYKIELAEIHRAAQVEALIEIFAAPAAFIN